MANSSTVKIATAALGGSGILVGGAVGIYHHLNKVPEENNKSATEKKKSSGKPISEWLADDDAVLLKSAEDEDRWKANWGQFISDYETNDLPSGWNINEWNDKKLNKKEVPSDFKTNCENNSEEKIESKGGGNYAKVLKYCAKETLTEIS